MKNKTAQQTCLNDYKQQLFAESDKIFTEYDSWIDHLQAPGKFTIKDEALLQKYKTEDIEYRINDVL